MTEQKGRKPVKRSRKIVATADTLCGAPRIDGHRIGVNHILGCCEAEEVVTDYIQKWMYPQLSVGQIRAAIRYAQKQVEKQRVKP